MPLYQAYAANQVIKVKNETAGSIVLKGNTSCNIFRQMGDANDYLLNFTLTVMTKDKSISSVKG